VELRPRGKADQGVSGKGGGKILSSITVENFGHSPCGAVRGTSERTVKGGQLTFSIVHEATR